MNQKYSAGTLVLPGPITAWDEALPLGNGLLGLLVWGGKKRIQVSLDCADLWDTRTPEAFQRSDWNWTELLGLIRKQKWDIINERFCRPGVAFPYPSKLPAGRLFIDLPAGVEVEQFVLDRATALGRGDWRGGSLEAFCDLSSEVAVLRFRGRGARWKLEAPPYTRKENKTGNGLTISTDLVALGYDAATSWRTREHRGFVQPTTADGSFAVAVASREDGEWTELYVSVQPAPDSATAKSKAVTSVSRAADRGWQTLFASHLKKWKAHWKRSQVSVPDPLLLDHYRQVSYFLGSLSRPDCPPISLQSVWTADDGKLPPWKGDYHHNLNTQLSYWPHLTAGHSEPLKGFLEFMMNLAPRHRELARKFFGCEGIFVPGAMANDGQLIGGYAQVSFCPTNGAWIAHLFYQYWQFTRDEAFLRSHVWPYCEGIGTFLGALLEKGEDGKLRLPVSASPEIHEGAPDGWVTPNSNYDLALMRWLFAALEEMAALVGASAAPWRKLLRGLEPLAVGDVTCDELPQSGVGPYLIAPGKPLHESHRHHSHLMAIYPLGLASVEDDRITREAIAQSFRQIDKLGTGLWTGYSFAWMACLAARTRQPERARQALRHFAESFVSQNGFHLNGDHHQRGLSWWNYRPFTLEGNFAFMEAVHEMLVQGAGGVIRIFPAVPQAWKDASFERLRVEGNSTVSAQRQDGRTREVRITAGSPGPIRVADPFGGKGRWSKPPRRTEGVLEWTLKPGDEVYGTA